MIMIQVKHNVMTTWDVSIQNPANGSVVYISHGVVKEEALRKADIMQRFLGSLDVRTRVMEV